MHLEGWHCHFPDDIEALSKELALQRLPFLRRLTMVSLRTLTEDPSSAHLDPLGKIFEADMMERVVGATRFIWKHRSEIPWSLREHTGRILWRHQ